MARPPYEQLVVRAEALVGGGTVTRDHAVARRRGRVGPRPPSAFLDLIVAGARELGLPSLARALAARGPSRPSPRS